MLGGATLGQGFHLVEVVTGDDAPQVEGENDEGHVSTSLRGNVTPNVPIVIDVGATIPPALFL
jgi:hypothetical protein